MTESETRLPETDHSPDRVQPNLVHDERECLWTDIADQIDQYDFLIVDKHHRKAANLVGLVHSNERRSRTASRLHQSDAMQHPTVFGYVVLQDNTLALSIDNTPEAAEPARDAYLRAMFSDAPAADAAMTQFHAQFAARNAQGEIEGKLDVPGVE